MEESQQVYIWCSMRFHKYVSACINVQYVFLVQYAVSQVCICLYQCVLCIFGAVCARPRFHTPPRTHFRWTGPQFYTTAPSFSLLPHFTLLLPLHCCRPLSLQFCSKQQQRPQEVALSACLGLACLSKNVSPLLLLKKENLPMCVFRYLPSYVSLLDWTISGQAASLSRIGILGSGQTIMKKNPANMISAP